MATRRHYLIRAALFAIAAGILGLAGCGQPKHDDPQVFWDQTPAQAAEGARLHARDLPGSKGTRYQTFGKSMQPLIVETDWIVVDGSVPYASVRVGQPITYLPDDDMRKIFPDLKPGVPVAHRVVAKDRHGLLLSGDNNARSEATKRVTEKHYIGVVVGIYTTRRKP